MACENLLIGIPRQCKTGIGGVKRFLLASYDDVISVSGATDGLIDSITMSAGTTFKEFVPSKDTSSWSDNAAPAAQNSGTVYVPTISMNFAKNQASTRNAVKMLGQNVVIALVQNNDEKWFLLGMKPTGGRGLEMIASPYASGVQIQDANNWNVVMSGGENEPAWEVSNTIIAGLL